MYKTLITNTICFEGAKCFIITQFIHKIKRFFEPLLFFLNDFLMVIKRGTEELKKYLRSRIQDDDQSTVNDATTDTNNINNNNNNSKMNSAYNPTNNTVIDEFTLSSSKSLDLRLYCLFV